MENYTKNEKGELTLMTAEEIRNFEKSVDDHYKSLLNEKSEIRSFEDNENYHLNFKIKRAKRQNDYQLSEQLENQLILKNK